MLKIRLRKPGKSIKGRTHQKIVVTEHSWARESKFIDELGYYDPARELLKIDVEKYKAWFERGARPSDTVASLFKNYGKSKKEVDKGPVAQEPEKEQAIQKSSQSAEGLEKEEEKVSQDSQEISDKDKNKEQEPLEPQEETKDN